MAGTIGSVIPVPHHHVHIQHAEGIGGAHKAGKVVTLMDRIGEHAKAGRRRSRTDRMRRARCGSRARSVEKRGDTINHHRAAGCGARYPRYPDLSWLNALLPTWAATAALEGIEKASVVIVELAIRARRGPALGHPAPRRLSGGS